MNSSQRNSREQRRDWRSIIDAHGIRPSKKLSQNFLIDPVALLRVVAAADLGTQDTVLEVGAGLGALTVELAAIARRVISVEIDNRLIPALEQVTAGMENVELLNADILEVDLGKLVGSQPYLVVANIPYHITSFLIRRLLEAPQPPQRLVLTVQTEVAQRVIAAPGEMNLLALGVQVYGTPRIVARIASGSFYPAPTIESAVLRVDVHPTPIVPLEHLDSIFRLARAGFGQKRKQLHNALAAGLSLPKDEVLALLAGAGIAPARRAQTLELGEWSALAALLLSG